MAAPIWEPADTEFALWYPVRFYKFSDGYFLAAVHHSLKQLSGAQVLTIAGKPVEHVMQQVNSLLASDNSYAQHEKLWPAHNAMLMNGLGFTTSAGKLKMTLKLKTGKTVEQTLSAEAFNRANFNANDSSFNWQYLPVTDGLPIDNKTDWVSAYNDLKSSEFEKPSLSRPLHMSDNAPFSSISLPEQDAYYIRAQYVSDTDFVTFFEATLAELDQVKPKHLMIDLRWNFGGDSSKIYTLIHALIKRLDVPPWQRMYVIVGRKTAGAGLILAHELKANVPVTIIGEPTASGPNHFSESVSKAYTDSGTNLYVSSRYLQLTHWGDLAESLSIDIPAVISSDDYATGQDPALDMILKGQEMRSLTVIARQHGGAAARAAYHDRQSKFSAIKWWSPPTEFELRQVCDYLQKIEDYQGALETCLLNTEIHPYIWNVWYNLAGAQRAAGQIRERLSSYRCMLLLAPDNWNAPAIKALLDQPENKGIQVAKGCPLQDG